MSLKVPKIESCSFGCVVVDGTEYNQDLVITPAGIQASWWRKSGHTLKIEDIEGIEDLKIEVLIVGTGAYDALRVPEETSKWVLQLGIRLIVLPTAEACDRYNELAGSGKVAAALHLTC